MPSGILIIDKPAGWTSMDVCAKVRGIFHEKRVGHGGTLDPMATGVLPVFVGQATRGVEFAENGQKEYVAGLRLGQVTDTQDVTGTTLETRPVTADRAALEALLPRFLGEQDQIPPMYSAVKVGGQKLYDLARKGQVVERKPRRITIYELELLAQESATDYLLRCRCSKGTYIRTLCHDIGAGRLKENGCLINGQVYRPEVWTPKEAHGADLLIVSLKYGALPGALDSIAQAVGEHTIVMSLMNGVDSEEIIAQKVNPDNILHALINPLSEIRCRSP